MLMLFSLQTSPGSTSRLPFQTCFWTSSTWRLSNAQCLPFPTDSAWPLWWGKPQFWKFGPVTSVTVGASQRHPLKTLETHKRTIQEENAQNHFASLCFLWGGQPPCTMAQAPQFLFFRWICKWSVFTSSKLRVWFPAKLLCLGCVYKCVF